MPRFFSSGRRSVSTPVSAAPAWSCRGRCGRRCRRSCAAHRRHRASAARSAGNCATKARASSRQRRSSSSRSSAMRPITGSGSARSARGQLVERAAGALLRARGAIARPGRRQPLDRQRARADLARAAPPPSTSKRGATAVGHVGAQRFGQRADLPRPAASAGAASAGPAPAARGAGRAQRGLQRGQRQLAHAQRALHRELADAADGVLAADDQPGLRAAEQLVAAEGDDVAAGGQLFLRQRLARQAVVRPGRSASRCPGRWPAAGRARGRWRRARPRRPRR